METDNQAGKLKPEMFVSGVVYSSPNEYRDKMIIPKSSLLWTGKRSVVYVKQPGTDQNIFRMREVETGPMLGNSYVIINGLSEGEEIVTSGTFSVDAAAQLEGKPSMMNTRQAGNLNFKNATFNVSGNCEMCKERIEKASLSVNGVKNAVWDMISKKIIVDFDSTKTDLLTIHKAIAKTGHDTPLVKADDAVYKSLPECCLYRK